MKDALVQAALSYKNLLDTEYEFRLGTSSRKMVITLISSTKGEFLHTIGLHHLEDVARFQTRKTFEKEIIFKDICKGKITLKDLESKTKMLHSPISDSINPATGKYYCVEDRIIALKDIAVLLDNAYMGNFYRWESKNAYTVLSNGKIRSSKISADYMLTVPTENSGENIFVFLRIDNREDASQDKSIPIKLSIFSAFPDTAKLQQGQRKYTILEESKIIKSDNTREQLYILPSYKKQIEKCFWWTVPLVGKSNNQDRTMISWMCGRNFQCFLFLLKNWNDIGVSVQIVENSAKDLFPITKKQCFHSFYALTHYSVNNDMLFLMSGHVETVILLSQLKPDDIIHVNLELDKMDTTSAEMKPTYDEIKKYILDKYNLKVSSLYISQIKRKNNLEVGESFNKPKAENTKQPNCPKEKADAIEDALRHFKIIK